jgi:hypothetical protein
VVGRVVERLTPRAGKRTRNALKLERSEATRVFFFSLAFLMFPKDPLQRHEHTSYLLYAFPLSLRYACNRPPSTCV